MHDSRVIANRFLELARARGETLTPIQVLKLVYIAHGWMLGLHRRPLIADPIEAWRYGPVVPKLYECVRRYRGKPVTDLMSQPLDAPPLDAEEADIVSQVDALYGPIDGLKLSGMTHAPGTPWSIVNARTDDDLVIPDEVIGAYYARLAADHADAPQRALTA